MSDVCVPGRDGTAASRKCRAVVKLCQAGDCLCLCVTAVLSPGATGFVSREWTNGIFWVLGIPRKPEGVWQKDGRRQLICTDQSNVQATAAFLRSWRRRDRFAKAPALPEQLRSRRACAACTCVSVRAHCFRTSISLLSTARSEQAGDTGSVMDIPPLGERAQRASRACRENMEQAEEV